jgi:hypothetical protein
MDRRARFTKLRERARRRAEIRLERDLLRDAQELSLLLEHGEELAQVLIRPHGPETPPPTRHISSRLAQAGDQLAGNKLIDACGVLMISSRRSFDGRVPLPFARQDHHGGSPLGCYRPFGSAAAM